MYSWSSWSSKLHQYVRTMLTEEIFYEIKTLEHIYWKVTVCTWETQPKWSILRHIQIKLLELKDKEKVIWVSRPKKKKINYNGEKIRFVSDLLTKTLHNRQQCNNIFIRLKKRNVSQRWYTQANFISFKNKGHKQL